MSQLIELRPEREGGDNAAGHPPAYPLRAEVLAFARLMEQRLREKDADKGVSWKTMREADLTAHAVSFAMRLEQAVRLGFFGRRKHAVDLANYCMMIADVSGALEVAPLAGGEEHY